MNSKPELRQMFRRLLEGEASVDSSARSSEQAVADLCERLVQNFKTHKIRKGRVWAAYQPAGFEADVRGALKALPEVDWVFPRVVGDRIHFLRPHAPFQFSSNKWGILEPDPAHSDEVNLSEIDGLLIPALAFDLQLNRLGRGKGYYDRALAEISQLNPHVIKIGVALDLQISNDPFPAESFDVPMDLVITEIRTLQPRSLAHPLESHTERKSS